ncbi:hypothetical protein [Desulfobacter curvatus]|uniref:hypothetical protein n=1 Tax=Desulfobacter curvatus TaxID=2290 RepID=UPI0012FCE746|nr:hypothetical protein [Desulfobacter curvatus]
MNTNTTIPCDVYSLVVSEAISNKSLDCSKKLRKEPFPANAPNHLKNYFSTYDLILEAVSEYKTSDPAPLKNVASLSIETSSIWTCPLGKHILIAVTPLGNYDAHKTWLNTTVQGYKIEGLSTEKDKAVNIGKWLSPFWVFGDDYIKEFRIDAEGCGVRDEGDPLTNLNALVRVYRKDDYELYFKIPPFKKIKRSRAGSVDAKGNKVISQSESLERGGQMQSESSSVRTVNKKEHTDYTTETLGAKDGAGYTTLSESSGKKKNNDYVAESEKYQEGRGSVTVNDSTDEGEEFLFELERQDEIKPTVSLKRNGSEVNFTKAINDIVNLQYTLMQAWNDIKEWVPKIGWSAELEISLMVGTVSGKWGYRVGNLHGPRFVAVERYVDIFFNMDVVTYKASVMFGVDFGSFDVLDWFGVGKTEIILKVEGSISGGASVSDTIKTNGQQGFTGNDSEVKGNSSVDLFVQGRVMVVGYGYEAKGGVTGGLKFEGKLTADFDNPPAVDGKFFFEETKIYARFYDAVEGERSKQYERIVFKRKNIWTGKIPNTSQNT